MSSENVSINSEDFYMSPTSLTPSSGELSGSNPSTEKSSVSSISRAHFEVSPYDLPPGDGGQLPPVKIQINAANCPKGLLPLLTLERIKVIQASKLEEVLIYNPRSNFEGGDPSKSPKLTNIKYLIKDENDELIYVAGEVKRKRTSWLGAGRPWDIIIYNMEGDEVVTIKRPMTCCLCWFGGACCCGWGNGIDMYAEGIGEEERVYLGRILQLNGYGPVLRAWKGTGSRLFDIRGPNCGICHCSEMWGPVEFRVVSSPDDGLGTIEKRWGGIVTEWLTTSDNYQIKIPQDTNPRSKAILISSTILLDFMYFENLPRSSFYGQKGRKKFRCSGCNILIWILFMALIASGVTLVIYLGIKALK